MSHPSQTRPEPTSLVTPDGPAGAASEQAALPIVITGHVDHGKSTVVGRLLADTGSLPDGKLDAVRAHCERNAKPFEYAFLLDALKDEQAQGITIDAARVFFKSQRRRYIIIDAPGHVEFLKNMVTGAARAEAALLVIDAREGVRENSRRHGYLLAMLGIRQIAVLVNKMDLVGHDRGVFERLSAEYLAFLAQLHVRPTHVIPVSGFLGENIAARADTLAWYGGPTVLDALDSFMPAAPKVDQPLRLPVQGVYKFTGRNDDRRIVAGTVEAGRLAAGDDVVFYPSGKRSRVRTLEAFNRASPTEVSAGQTAGATLDEQVYVTRGELLTKSGDAPPLVATRVRVSLFWLGRQPLQAGRPYLLKLGTARVPMQLEQVHRVIDASSLESSDSADAVRRHEVAECTLALAGPLAFDCASQVDSTSRFVIVDEFDISGGGIIHAAVADDHARTRESVLRRNLKWAPSGVSAQRRAERYSQRPALLLLTGEREVERKALGRALEAQLFEDGRLAYLLAIGNVVYGVDADLERTNENRAEHLRRLGEVANLLLDAGLIVIATAIALTQRELELLRTTVDRERVTAVWCGERPATDIVPDLMLPDPDAVPDAVARLKSLLQDKGVIFKPW